MPEKASLPRNSRTKATSQVSKRTQQPISEETAQAVAASLAELSQTPSRPVKARRAVASDKAAILDSIADSAGQGKTRQVKKREEHTAQAAPRTNVPALSSPFAPTLSDPFAGQGNAKAKPMQRPAQPMTTLLFQAPDVGAAKVRRRVAAQPQAAPVAPTNMAMPMDNAAAPVSVNIPIGEGEETSRPRRRGSRGRSKNTDVQAPTTPQKAQSQPVASEEAIQDKTKTSQQATTTTTTVQTPEGTTVRTRTRHRDRSASTEPAVVKGSTRLEAKRQRRKEGRDAGRRRHSITESEYLARRESVHRQMLIREQNGLNQIAVLEDDVLVEHYVARHTQASMVGNVYLGRVQNVLPSMEAAFVDIGKGRNAVLYAGEVNWEAAGMDGKPRAIEQALKTGDTVLVQVTKDPIGHNGARLTAQITLAGRHLVLVPSGAMTGISRKLPERERIRLKRLLRQVVPPEHSVIVRTAAEGATEEQLRLDVERLTQTWQEIQDKVKNTKNAPMLLKGEPELAVRVVRDIFNEDFESLHIQGDSYQTISGYVAEM
ncbi:MAG: ribonuclease E/G [Actinomycetaceae bacterium]|nr:ribonuclease E/G [Actinomycetaceae bacterium]